MYALGVTMIETIRPGLVGPVGDVLPIIKLATSTPDMQIRQDTIFNRKNLHRLGSYVQDGFSMNPLSKGAGAVTNVRKMSNTNVITPRGYSASEISTLDKTREPVMGFLGRYNSDNRKELIYKSFSTGDLFEPLPGRFDGGFGVPRGGQLPRVIRQDTSNPIDTIFDNNTQAALPSAGKTRKVRVCTFADGKRTFKKI